MYDRNSMRKNFMQKLPSAKVAPTLKMTKMVTANNVNFIFNNVSIMNVAPY